MDIIVSEHKGFAAYCIAEGLCSYDVKAVSYASPIGVSDKIVITSGLTFNLAAMCKEVILIHLNIPDYMRGVDLSEEQVRLYSSQPVTYIVHSKDDYNTQINKAFSRGEITGHDKFWR